jgi:hypothetical protein
MRLKIFVILVININIKYNTLRGRLQNGWSISDAIEIKPIKGANQHGIHYTQRLSNKID